MAELGNHDPSFSDLAQDQVPNRVTRYSFMALVAKLNGLAFFPKVAEFCDPALHAYCDSTVMTRAFFAPLCMSGTDKLIVITANPWNPIAEEYLAPRFPLSRSQLIQDQPEQSLKRLMSKTWMMEFTTSMLPRTMPNQWRS